METIRQKVLANLCVLGGERGKALLDYLGETERQALLPLIEEWDGLDRAEAVGRMRRLMNLATASLLGEVHPGWFVEKLQAETPRLYNVLKHYLSPEQLQYLRSHLPPETRRCFSEVGEPEQAVLDAVRPLIEKKLGLVMPPRTGDTFEIRHLGWMKLGDLRVLCRELGLQEICRAFVGMGPRPLHAFLSRFPLRQAKELRWRINEQALLGPLEQKRARIHILGLSLDHIPTERLFEQVGYSLLARAIPVTERHYFEIIVLKMRPEEGYPLKKLMEETRVHPEETGRAALQVLQTVARLADKGMIHRFWLREEETTAPERSVA